MPDCLKNFVVVVILENQCNFIFGKWKATYSPSENVQGHVLNDTRKNTGYFHNYTFNTHPIPSATSTAGESKIHHIKAAHTREKKCIITATLKLVSCFSTNITKHLNLFMLLGMFNAGVSNFFFWTPYSIYEFFYWPL